MRCMTTHAIGLVVALGASGCFRTATGATQGQLYRRAEIDLACPGPQLRHFDLDSRARLVQGCGKQLVYVESCEPIRGDFRCTWLADSPDLAPGPVSFVIPTAPVTWRPTAPANAAASAEPHVTTPTAQVAPTPPRESVGPPDGGHGLLSVASVGGHCSVAVDGRAFGATPIAGIVVPEGVARVSCETPSQTVQQDVRIEPGRTARLRFDLEAPTNSRLDWGF